MAGQYDFWLLDLDGTLVDVDSCYIHEVMGRVGDRLGVGFDAADAEGLWYENESRRSVVLDAHGIEKEDFWTAFHEIEEPVARAEATYVYDDAAAVVPGLETPVGLVTHCQPYLTDTVLEHNDIGDWFDTVVCCGDEIGWKPDPRPLELAMADLDVETDLGAMAGDAESDVEAARAAGLDAIHVARKSISSAPASDRRIATLTDVVN